MQLADFAIWKQEYTKELSTTTADFSGDGMVSLSDYVVWRASLNEPSPSVTPPPVQPASRIRWNGKDWYLSGVNMPWYVYSFGQGSGDFGGGSSSGVIKNKAVISAGFAKLKETKSSVVRWWMFEGDAWQIKRDASGMPTGIDPVIYPDIDVALELAETHNLYYVFVLFGDTVSFPTSWRTNPAQRTKLAAVLGEVFAKYKDHPRIISWELFNEPEWQIWNRVEGVTEEEVKAMSRELIKSIRANAPNKLTSMGNALIDGFNNNQRGIEMWTDVDLDFYSPHWYDGHRNPVDLCAICTTAPALQTKFNTKKPIIIGEYQQGSGSTAENVARQNEWYTRGYAGAWGWSLFADRTNDKFPVDLEALKQFNSQHPDIGP